MEMPKVISATERTQKGSSSDVFLRALICVVVGVVGFWYPLWYMYAKLPPEDDRGGIALAAGLPFTICFAIWASLGLRRLPKAISKGKRLALVAGVVVLCWAPLIYASLVILLNVISELLRLL